MVQDRAHRRRGKVVCGIKGAEIVAHSVAPKSGAREPAVRPLLQRRVGDRMVIRVTPRMLIIAGLTILAVSYLAAGAFNWATPRRDATFTPNFEPGVIVVAPPAPDAQEPAGPPQAPAPSTPQLPNVGGPANDLRSL